MPPNIRGSAANRVGGLFLPADILFAWRRFADDDTRVQAVVGMSPPTDLEFDLPRRGGLSTSLQHLLNRPKEVTEECRKLLHEMSPINYVKPGLPPFFLMQGDKDNSVPYQGSLNFQAKLEANGDSCDFLTLKGRRTISRHGPSSTPISARRLSIGW